MQPVVSPSISASQQAETPRLSPDGNRLALAVDGDLFVNIRFSFSGHGKAGGRGSPEQKLLSGGTGTGVT